MDISKIRKELDHYVKVPRIMGTDLENPDERIFEKVVGPTVQLVPREPEWHLLIIGVKRLISEVDMAGDIQVYYLAVNGSEHRFVEVEYPYKNSPRIQFVPENLVPTYLLAALEQPVVDLSQPVGRFF